MQYRSRRASRRAALFAVALVATTASVLWPRQVLSHETLTTTVLFDREIVRILNQHCVMCHVENGPSFPLATYEDTFLRGRKIRAEVIARHMPPWAAVSGYGQFVNENTPTLRETQFLVSWVEGLGPRNAGTVFLNVLDSGLPRPKVVRAEASFGQWQLGPPNLKRELPANTIDPQRGDVVDANCRRSRLDLRATGSRPGVHAGRSASCPCGVLHAAGNGAVARELDALVWLREVFRRARRIAWRRALTSWRTFTTGAQRKRWSTEVRWGCFSPSRRRRIDRRISCSRRRAMFRRVQPRRNSAPRRR